MTNCQRYFNEGLSRTINSMSTQDRAACNIQAIQKGIPRPGTNAWKLAHPGLSGGRKGTRKGRKGTRKGRKGSKSRRNRH